jgi:hypothetical protein
MNADLRGVKPEKGLHGISRVSIQLVSPASGDLMPHLITKTPIQVSIQLVSPASGDFRSKSHLQLSEP